MKRRNIQTIFNGRLFQTLCLYSFTNYTYREQSFSPRVLRHTKLETSSPRRLLTKPVGLETNPWVCETGRIRTVVWETERKRKRNEEGTSCLWVGSLKSNFSEGVKWDEGIYFTGGQNVRRLICGGNFVHGVKY